MGTQAILFDLDGTIWDSYPWYASAVGFQVSKQEIVAQLRAGHSIVSLLRRYRVPERALIENDRPLELFPTVRDTLRVLKRDKVRIGAVTNLPGRIALPMLERADLHEMFGTVIHAGNCRPLKPYAKPILLALANLKCSVERNAVYVGDTATDAESARNAGVSFGWAAYGYGRNRPPSTDFVLQQLSDVLSFVAEKSLAKS